MKECPKCRQLFADRNLRFCRFDGSPLIDEVITPPHEAATILFSTGQLNNRSTPLNELRRKSGKLSK
ncbi:MAG TPA: hypothetical protein VJM50_22240 [Pyrinomonadaceae bacterium]|nr:hypothetical protein [Pyrinomonadaceae bacterium]